MMVPLDSTDKQSRACRNLRASFRGNDTTINYAMVLSVYDVVALRT